MLRYRLFFRVLLGALIKLLSCGFLIIGKVMLILSSMVSAALPVNYREGKIAKLAC